MAAVGGSLAALGVTHADADTGHGRGLQPVSAQRDARRARPGFHPHRAGQRPDPPPSSDQARFAYRFDTAGHAVRLRGGRFGDRRGVRREDLRLARHGRGDGAGSRDAGHQHRRRDHGVRRRCGVAGRPALRFHLRRTRSPGACVMTATVPTEFASRRTLVLRRFLRRPSAVASLVVLLVLFVGCYTVPSLLPFSYSDLDFNALLQPPNARHWLGTNALGQDLLAQTLRGMQKSMLIAVCVAFISTGIAATVGSISGYFGGWRDRALMWFVALMLVVPGFLLIMILTPRTKSSGNV